MNAAKVGPKKTQVALTKNTLPSRILNGKRPTPFAESANGTKEEEDQRMTGEQALVGRDWLYGGGSGGHVEAPLARRASLANPAAFYAHG